MHYSEIEMAESMSASTKISARNLVCRLYVHGGSHESRYNLRICSKAGLSKDLYLKVYKTCGNAVKFLRTIRSVMCYMLCRGGVTFVNKMGQFMWGAQSVDNTPSDLNSEYSVKRCVQLSPPSSHQPSKRSVYQ